jgi:hypothetical protein
MWKLTALSIPSMMSMKKKRIAQNWLPGRGATACGYTSNTNPGPEYTEFFW